MLHLSDEDYLEQETEIIVQGTFETYKEPNDETLLQDHRCGYADKKIRREKMDHEGIREKD